MKRMIIECGEELSLRVVSEEGEDLFSESQQSTGIGNIYKGVVLQLAKDGTGATVDYGAAEPGFLPTGLIHWAYGADRPPRFDRHGFKSRSGLEDLLTEGQAVLVQLTEDRFRPGITLTTQLTLASAYLVIMPGNRSRAVSKKIHDERERQRLLSVLDQFEPPSDLGFVVRTSAAGIEASKLRRELLFLLSTWKEIAHSAAKAAVPSLVHQDGEFFFDKISAWTERQELGQVSVDKAPLERLIKRYLEFYFPGAPVKVSAEVPALVS